MSAADEIRDKLNRIREDLSDAVKPEVVATTEALEDAMEQLAESIDSLDKVRAMCLHLAQRFSALGGDILEATGDIPEGLLASAMNICGLAYSSADELAEYAATVAQLEYIQQGMVNLKAGIQGLGVYANLASSDIEGAI